MTAVVLAGGASRRMGRDKTTLPYQGESLLERACRRFSAFFDPVWISVKDPRKQGHWDQVPDLYKGCGPLAGLHASLSRNPKGGLFLVAADMPLAEPALALHLTELGMGHQACVLTGEPLFGWYSLEVLPVAASLLQNGEYRMTHLLESLDTRYVSPEELPGFDVVQILQNINDPKAYEALLRGE